MTLPSYAELAKMIDHSLLKPTMTEDELEAGCRLAVEYDVATVCIMPYYLARAAELLQGSSVLPTTTVGFPHGGQSTRVKQLEAEQALSDGARELDMVVNISQVLSGDYEAVRTDILAVLQTTHARGQKLKVIFENCYLDEAQKIRLCEICGELSVDWVKTSTGFGTSGARIDDLILMRKHSPSHVQVKAAGGVQDLEMLLKIREVGATRSGCSKTAEVLGELRRRLALGGQA
ncbi:MAG TPA: deoxyribose-phosphate aldolase [Polyangiaceae bacterium]|nr:deoxyribose-phosphate aldolase [Polyangiaceae bacterium]